MTVSEFISSLGGNAVVARKIGKKRGAVGLWVHRNKIPRDAWPDLIREYPEQADNEKLLKLEEQAAEAA